MIDARRHTRRARCGFTLIEAMMSMVIVSILLVAAMRATGASGITQFKTAQQMTGRLLADGLINEILSLDYVDPGSATFGPEGGEIRGVFDDVDDFAGWTESPPQQRDGSTMPNLAGWKRQVNVDRVVATNLSQVSASETGAKRITVKVFRNNELIAQRIAIRTGAP